MRIFKTEQLDMKISSKRNVADLFWSTKHKGKRACLTGLLTATVVLVGQISGHISAHAETKVDSQKTNAQGIQSFGRPSEEKVQYTSFVEAYRQGMSGYRAGRMDIAIPALEYAAEGNLLGAQLWLARIYASGVHGAPVDEAKAFQNYQKIADRFSETSPYSRYSRLASEAFIAVAGYYHKGIPSLYLKENSEEAFRLYHHAATYFQDPKAQFFIAQMYIKGDGVEKNPNTAASWLLNASRKNYAPAQAYLGEMLWSGRDIKAQQAKGLALIKLAKLNAIEQDKPWIVSLHDKIESVAGTDLKKNASQLVAHWEERAGAARVAANKSKTEVLSADNGSVAAHPTNGNYVAMPAGYTGNSEEQSKSDNPYMGGMTSGFGDFRPVDVPVGVNAQNSK